MTKRALIYTRASLDATGERKSQGRQEAACRALAAARGWDVFEVKTETQSAYGARERPVWGEVLDVVEAGAVDVVVAWHLDRMTRSMLDLERLITLAEGSGVGVATATGDIDLTTDTGRMVARILAAVARAEVERKAERQRLANAQRAEAGAPHTGGARSFGYERDGRTIVSEEADALRDGALAVLRGESVRSVARDWSARGLRSSRAVEGGEGWSPRGVRGALLSPRYAGIRTYRGAEVGPGDWTPILDLETHLALRAALEAPGRTHGTVKAGRKAANLLSGLARCWRCEGKLSASKSRGKETYICRTSMHLSVSRVELDEYVKGIVLARLKEPDALELLAGSGDDGVDAAREEAAECRRRLDGVADAFAAGLIDGGQLATASRGLRERLERAEDVLAGAGRSSVLAELARADDVAARWDEWSLEQRRQAVEAAVDVVVEGGARWRPEGKVAVTFR